MSFHPETDTYKYWTQAEDLKLQELLIDGKLSFVDIGKIMERSGLSCQSRSRELGLKSKYRPRSYSVNEDFWAAPNPLNCYWAGFSAADASITTKNGRNFTYSLELQKRDEMHLRSLVDSANFTGRVYEYHYHRSPTVIMKVNCDKWAADLKKNFAIEPNKVRRLGPPPLNSDILSYYWLIGYTDGDGTIFPDSHTNELLLNYSSCSFAVLEWIWKFIIEKFPHQLRARQHAGPKKFKHADCWGLSFSGIRTVVAVDYLRKLDAPKLARKWENPKLLEMIAAKKAQFPQFFTGPKTISA